MRTGSITIIAVKAAISPSILFKAGNSRMVQLIKQSLPGSQIDCACERQLFDKLFMSLLLTNPNFIEAALHVVSLYRNNLEQ